MRTRTMLGIVLLLGTGACEADRAGPGATGELDHPIWGQVDPVAGLWFSAQASQLAQNANPALF
jgi:hypothetical protein